MINSLTQVTQTKLINLRWLSVGAMLAAALISPQILGTHELMPKLLAFAVIIASINICLAIAVYVYHDTTKEIAALAPCSQLIFDLFSWTGFIYLSGGATNPLISVFLPIIAFGAIALSAYQAWLIGLIAISLYSFLWRFYVPLRINDPQHASYLHLLGMWLVFTVSAVISIWFIRKISAALHERDIALAQAREKNLRQDWLVSFGTLAAGTAHEMGTPLTTLAMLVEELIDDPSFPLLYQDDLILMQKQIETCRQSLNRLSHRAQTGIGNSRLSTSDYFRHVAQDWQNLHPTITLRLHLENSLGLLQKTFPATLEHAINNLLDNAMQAGAAEIILEVKTQHNAIFIALQDDGCGISQDALDDFNKSIPHPSKKGMGIGLMISKTAIEQLEGTLVLRCIPNHGTKAEIMLPVTV